MLIVVDQLTSRRDRGEAAAFIRTTLREAGGQGGCAVLVIGLDLDELLEFTDRIAVMSEGHLTQPVPVAETSREAIGLAMGGFQRRGRGGQPCRLGPSGWRTSGRAETPLRCCWRSFSLPVVGAIMFVALGHDPNPAPSRSISSSRSATSTRCRSWW